MNEVTTEALKAAPPVTVATAAVSGLDVNMIVGWATVAYIALQAAYLIWKWRKDYRNGK